MATTRLRIAVLGLGLALFGASLPAEAITITDVSVTIGGTSFNASTVGWQFPVTLLAGQDLVLTQNFQGPPNTTTSYNFDTSDVLGPSNFPQIAITADGVTTVFTDLNQVLNVKGIDVVTNVDNEAQSYGAPLIGTGYSVFLGYADNLHTGPCGAWANSVGLSGSATCLPSPFFGASFFQGRGGLNPPQLTQTNPFHCTQGGVADCYEGGVIRIVATQVPEPATMALLAAGGAMLTVRRYRRAAHPRRTS